MPTADLTSPGNIDVVLRVLSWSVIVFGALWLITGVIGVFHRRAYNLTRAESGGSKNIKPDFLKVDKDKRQAAIDRGKAYDAVLEARESAAARTPVEQVCIWSRLGALVTAIVGLAMMIFTTLTRIGSLQAGVNEISSWERLSQVVSQNKAGAVVAFVVIGVGIVESSKKWKTPARR